MSFVDFYNPWTGSMVPAGGFRKQIQAAKKLQSSSFIKRYLDEMEKANPEKRVKKLQEIAKLLKPDVAPHFVVELSSYLEDASQPVRHATLSVFEIALTFDPAILIPVLGPIAARLEDDDAHVRIHALEMIATSGAKAILEVIPFIPSMVEALNDPDPKVVKQAVECTSKIGQASPNATIPHITKFLTLEDQQNCLNCLNILAQIGRVKPKGLKRAIPGIISLIGEKKSPVGEAARELLASLGQVDPDLVVPELNKLLLDTDNPTDQQWGALRVATFIAEKHPKHFVPILDQIGRDLRSNEWVLREQSAFLLGNVGKRSLARVKDAIPALVETLADADELVRSAAQKAIELINISSVDYTRIEKATKALKSAEFIIKSSRNFGAKVEQAEALMGDAQKAFSHGQYKDAFDYAQKAEKLAHRQEKLISETRDVIRSCREKVKGVARAGIAVTESENMLAMAEKALKRQDFKGARLKANRAAKKAKDVKAGARPDLTLKGKLSKPLEPDNWSPLSLLLRNLGAAAARDVTLKFSDTIAVRGPSVIDKLAPGKDARLKLSCFPKSKGLVPFSVDIVYHSYDGAYFTAHLKDILEVGGKQPDFRPRELFVSPIQATIVPKETRPPRGAALEELTPRATGPLSPGPGPGPGSGPAPGPGPGLGPPTEMTPPGTPKVGPAEEYSVICDNCSARIPSNFRICGRCGHRLPTHQERTIHKCPTCQTEIIGDYKFCGKCGASLSQTCPQCQSPVIEGFRFCGRCGTKVG